MASEPDDGGVAHINVYGDKNFKGCLKCCWSEGKGRIVHAKQSYKEGEVILVESPLHVVQEQEKSAAFSKVKQLCAKRADDFDYAPLWYWCAVQSLTKEQLKGSKLDGLTGTSPEIQRNLLLLHHEQVEEPSSAAKILKTELAPGADPMTIERLIQIWVLNCFEYSDEPQGYSTYFFSSFMSHSCFPNAVWHYSGPDHVLRARRAIVEGDEVCISYLPESGLFQSAPSRRMELNETKRFWCTCERCAEGFEDKGRGPMCPKCHNGAIFARTPLAGPAKDGSLLASHFEGVACDSCKHCVTKAETQALARTEKKLQDLVDKYTKDETSGPTVKQLETDEKFIADNFKQHVLADLAWEQLAQYYVAKHRMTDQRRVLELRRTFHMDAYPGLSGAHAWVLEALGDCILNIGKADAEDGKKAASQSPVAKEHYEEAIRVLTLMFGSDHEYVTDVVAKRPAE